jgi:uncharacterized membrane protein YGL010W
MINKLMRSLIKLLYVTLKALGISIAMTIFFIFICIVIMSTSILIGKYILFFLPIEIGVIVGALFSVIFYIFGINEFINWKNGYL